MSKPGRIANILIWILSPAILVTSILVYEGLNTELLYEEARLHRFERSAAFSVVDNLGFEVFSMFSSVGTDIGGNRMDGTPTLPQALAAINNYYADARFPGLLSEVVLVDCDGAGAYTYLRYEDGKLTEAQRPLWIKDQDLFYATDPQPPNSAGRNVVGFSLDDPVLVARVKRPQSVNTGLVAVAMRFDANEVTNNIVPALVKQAFSEDNATSEYDAVVFRMGEAMPAAGEFADLVVPLLPWTPFDSWNDYYRIRLRVLNTAGIASDLSFQSGVQSWYSARVNAAILPQEPGWYLAVTRKPSGIDSYVIERRLRNAIVSFLVFAVIGGGLFAIYLSARRIRLGAERERSFTALVSHELKTPIAVIRSLSDNLAAGVVEGKEKSREYGAVIRGESERLSSMIENILSLAAMQGGGEGPQLHEIDCERLLRDVAERFKRLAEEHRISIEVETEAKIPPVLGNGPALSAALDNLVGNAIRYSSLDNEVRKVFISARRYRKAGRPGVIMIVRDQGPGIPQEERRNLFKPYSRGSAAYSKRVPGSGVGLSLVKQIVRSFGGRVRVASKTGIGSAFSLWLRESRG